MCKVHQKLFGNLPKFKKIGVLFENNCKSYLLWRALKSHYGQENVVAISQSKLTVERNKLGKDKLTSMLSSHFSSLFPNMERDIAITNTLDKNGCDVLFTADTLEDISDPIDITIHSFPKIPFYFGKRYPLIQPFLPMDKTKLEDNGLERNINISSETFAYPFDKEVYVLKKARHLLPKIASINRQFGFVELSLNSIIQQNNHNYNKNPFFALHDVHYTFRSTSSTTQSSTLSNINHPLLFHIVRTCLFYTKPSLSLLKNDDMINQVVLLMTQENQKFFEIDGYLFYQRNWDPKYPSYQWTISYRGPHFHKDGSSSNSVPIKVGDHAVLYQDRFLISLNDPPEFLNSDLSLEQKLKFILPYSEKSLKDFFFDRPSSYLIRPLRLRKDLAQLKNLLFQRRAIGNSNIDHKQSRSSYFEHDSLYGNNHYSAMRNDDMDVSQKDMKNGRDELRGTGLNKNKDVDLVMLSLIKQMHDSFSKIPPELEESIWCIGTHYEKDFDFSQVLSIPSFPLQFYPYLFSCHFQYVF